MRRLPPGVFGRIMEEMPAALLSFVAAYVVGSIPSGLVLTEWRAGIDIRRFGTGNFGAANVFRNVSLRLASVVALASFLQGMLPPMIAWRFAHSESALLAAAVGAVAGYAWSSFLGFHGGRAVGCATGALAVVAPPAWLAMLAVYALGGLTRSPAPGVLAGLLLYLALVARMGDSSRLAAAGAIVAIILAKRLEGARADLGRPHAAAAIFDRLVFDRRPGDRLVGPIGG